MKGIERKHFGEVHVPGSEVEQELLGSVQATYFERFKEAPYVPYKQAMAMVKELQPFDPADPEPRFANDLHATVAEKLQLEDYSQLKFYTAVSKTHLDVFHGVDGLFEFRYGSGHADTVTVTLDLTTRPKDSWKADTLITVPDEGFDFTDPQDKKRYRACIDDTAEKIVRAVQYKLARRKRNAA